MMPADEVERGGNEPSSHETAGDFADEQLEATGGNEPSSAETCGQFPANEVLQSHVDAGNIEAPIASPSEEASAGDPAPAPAPADPAAEPPPA